MIASRNRRLLSIVAGVLVVGVPAAMINRGLNAYIERQGRDEAEIAAKRAISRAEWRLDQVMAGLRNLSQTSISTCDDVKFGALRRVIMTTTPIKELSIVGEDGVVRCAQLGPAVQSWPISRELAAGDGEGMIAVVRSVEGHERALRVRWRRPGDSLSLAAFVPGDMFVTEDAANPTTARPHVRVMLSEGSSVAGLQSDSEAAMDPKDRIFAAAASARYPVVANASISRARLLADHADLINLGLLGSAAFAAFAVGMVVWMKWRNRDNPVAEIERAIEANEFVPYYQPVVDILSGRLLGAEVLVRWRKSDGTVVVPANFIPLVESSGLVLDLTRALMLSTLAEAGEAVGRRPKFSIGFNLAACHLADDGVVDDVRRIFEHSPIALSQIVLEVTERERLEDLTAARRVIAALQGLGCRIAIDDVGTGHGGLSYVLKLGVDVIKIDKLFVDAIDSDRHSTTIIRSLVELARSMRMGIVAEGVETFEQVINLRDHGIRAAQGFVFAPPLPGPAFLQLLDALDPVQATDRRPVATAEPPDAIAARFRQAAA